MTKPTRGPWSLNKYGEPVDASGENIRAKGLALTNTDEAKANSVLIAAAPELQASVHDLVAFVGVMLGRGTSATIPETIATPLGAHVKIGQIMRDAQAALAKSEGSP